MSPTSTMQPLVDAYLAARRSVGFDLRIDGRQLHAFARFADHARAIGARSRSPWPCAGRRARGGRPG